nr:unnamed protein product [Callosobruchus analis]
MRCQQYGHSRTYCNRPYVCVKCGGGHSTASCKKPKDTPAKCALCNGDHPANYKGCEHYHKLLNANSANKVNHARLATSAHNVQNSNINPNRLPSTSNRSYANVVVSNSYHNNDQTSEQNNILSQFLNEFKAMFNQLIQQNSMVLNMLTTLISKIDK